jgi:hypothetical protein
LCLEAAGATATAQNSLLFLEILVRSISLGIQFRRPELIDRGFRRMSLYRGCCLLCCCSCAASRTGIVSAVNSITTLMPVNILDFMFFSV